MASLKDPAKRRNTVVRWTKAHRALNGTEGEAEAADIQGNAAADEAVGAAIALHPPLGTEVDAAVLFHTNRIPHVVAAVTAAMACYPPAAKNMGRAPRPTNLDEARQTEKHLWEWAAGTWRCRACGDYITAASAPRHRQHQRCSGQSMADRAEYYAARGHKLVKVESELPFICCTQCGARGNRRTRRLGMSCGEPTVAGQQALKRIVNNQHPLLSGEGRGPKRSRAMVRIVAVHNALDKRWGRRSDAPRKIPASRPRRPRTLS